MVLAYLVRDVLPLTRSVNAEGFKTLIHNAILFGMSYEDYERQDAMDTVAALDMPTVHTLKKLLQKHFTGCKEVVRRILEKAKYVCTTTDGWSCRRKSFLGTTVHWIDPKTLVRRSACLGGNRLKGHHTHKVLACAMLKLNNHFNITKNLVATVTDNASNFCAAFRVFGEGTEEPPQIASKDVDEEEEINEDDEDSDGDDNSEDEPFDVAKREKRRRRELGQPSLSSQLHQQRQQPSSENTDMRFRFIAIDETLNRPEEDAEDFVVTRRRGGYAWGSGRESREPVGLDSYDGESSDDEHFGQ
jgi:hypothetical protein